jgi:hypothetical protein
MTFARYFIPLIIEGNKRGIKSKLFFERKQKYNCPVLHMDALRSLSSEHDFEIHDTLELKKHPKSLVFSVEGIGLNYIDEDNDCIVLTYMVDYRDHYKNYINRSKNVIFPSKYMADLYNCESDKNLYLGSPKYDFDFDLDSIIKKYNLNKDKKNAFVILPKTRDAPIFANNFLKLYDCLHNLGYSIITKTRGKDAYSSFLGDFHFMDYSWHPHDTMELMHVSDIVINFSSTSIKECILLNKPLVNFNIKPFDRFLNDLYKHDYCIDLPINFEPLELKESILKLTKTDLSEDYQKAKDLYLFEPGEVSESILEKCL